MGVAEEGGHPRGTSFWDRSREELFRELISGPGGLSPAEAEDRIRKSPPAAFHPRSDALRAFLGQFASPIMLLLLAAAVLSWFLGSPVDAAIIVAIVLASGILSFTREFSAGRAVERLMETIRVRATVVRGGEEREVPASEVVPGDVVLLSAGMAVPGDAFLLESRDLFVDEASLTGESLPAEKEAGAAAKAPSRPGNSLFAGTHVVSGTARALVVRTGNETDFGRIAERLRLRPPETAFERGVRQFGAFLVQVTLLLVLAIFAFNVFFHRPVLDSFLFSLALAVGLTPQLLPAIISVNLTHGARRMAEEKVIVRRLASIEDFGSMDVLCADKTGTLTEGVVRVIRAVDCRGEESGEVLAWAYLNAANETGFTNPIDKAIRALSPPGTEGWRKLDEVPYDFTRRLLSVLMEKEGRRVMVTKGALSQVLAACSRVDRGGKAEDLADCEGEVRERLDAFSREGYRLLGVALREVPADRVGREDERGMTFLGALVLGDRPKEGIARALADLKDLGIAMKVITGDNHLVAAHLAREVGIPEPVVLAGGELRGMTDEALGRKAEDVDVFAEVEPGQKERIILAFKKTGHVVGFLGDGINDAPALHAADVGISVDDAVDVAREAADIVLLERDLSVLADGVRAGRATFANTLKYVHMASSANFGNMFSMAGASLFLPFLPLLPKQILLTNLLTDMPEMTIASDRVDPELAVRPQRWDIRSIRRFMAVFGLLSSFFDFATFGILLLALRAAPGQFRTGWFMESVVSAAAVVLVVRTRRPAAKSRPGPALLAATLGVMAAAFVIPYSPLAGPLGFVPLPRSFLVAMSVLVGLYLLSAEAVKKWFFRAGSKGGRE